MAKSKVPPIKRLTMPWLELCGAVIITQLLSNAVKILNIPTKQVCAWTDSVIVLSWLCCNLRRFKTFVGDRVLEIFERISPTCWHHVNGKGNPADCTSIGLFPSELAQHPSWWKGPGGLRTPQNKWPSTPELVDKPV